MKFKPATSKSRGARRISAHERCSGRRAACRRGRHLAARIWSGILGVFGRPSAVSAGRDARLYGRQDACRHQFRRGGFTLAEVLAALTFMAIVIPVAIEGLRIANRAGVVAQRKTVAARVAERVLNEALIGSQSQARNGVVHEGAMDYRWSIRQTTWPEDTMRVVTAEVFFLVQGQEHDVRLSTLVSNAQ